MIPKYSIPVDRSHTYGILSINQNYVASLPLTHAHFSSVLTTVLVYKVLHGLALQYLGPLNYVADLPGRRTLRSAGTNRLAVPPVKLTTVANLALPVVGQRTWNDPPDDVTSAESLSTFRQRLKTHTFAKSFF